MQRKPNHAALAGGLLILLFCSGSPAIDAQEAQGVSGPWDLTVETQQGTANPSVNFKQEGEKLTGTYRGRLGESAVEGTLQGNAIQFSVKLRFRDQEFVVVYRGTVEGASMKGTVQFGDSGSSNWTARRKS